MGYIEKWHRGPIPVRSFSHIYLAKGGTLEHLDIALDGTEVQAIQRHVEIWLKEAEEAKQPGKFDLGKALEESSSARRKDS
jgi:hypothetical protein